MCSYYLRATTALLLTAFLYGCSGGSATIETPFTPTLSSLSSTIIAAGSTSLILAVSGAGFTSSSTVRWNGASIPTTYVSSSQLTSQLSAGNFALSGQYQITVFNPGTGGGTSAPLFFTVASPLPILQSLSPTTAASGAASLSITVTGKNFVTGSLVVWNGTTLPTSYVSATQLTAQIPSSYLAAATYAQVAVLNPAPGGGQGNATGFSVFGGSTRLSVLPVNANDIVWDAIHNKIYASLPSSDGSIGNSVVALDPVTATIGTPQYAGSEPNLMAISSDASYLWVGLDGRSAIQRLNLPGLSTDISIQLPPLETVLSIQAAPVNPHTMAAVAGIVGYSPQSFGGAIYDDATPRTGAIASLDSIQWGSDDTRLYGEGFLDRTFATHTVDPTGITAQRQYPGVIQQYVGAGHFDIPTGHIFVDDGQVIDPATGDLVGSFNLSAIMRYNGFSPQAPNGVFTRCVPDSSQPKIFCVGLSKYGYLIESFDKSTLRRLNTILLPQVTGEVVKLIRWGQAGLAFNTRPSVLTSASPGSIYIVDGEFVNSSTQTNTFPAVPVQVLPVLTSITPQSAPAGSSNLTVSIYGSNFVPGALVYWNSFLPTQAVLPTTFINSGQLQVTLSSSQLTSAGYNSVTVANGPPANTTLDDVAAFIVTVPGSTTIAQSLASYDIAWSKVTGMIYAAVWDLDSQYPNSIVSIEPTTGKIIQAQSVGSNPYIVRPTSDGAYLYIAYLSSNSATRVDLPGLGNPLTWSLRYSPTAYPWIALDLQPAPGVSQTSAVSLGSAEASPHGLGGVTIFDNGIARPTRANGFGGSFGEDYISLQWGKDTSTLFGADITDLESLSVNSSGVSPGRKYHLGTYHTNAYLDIRYDAGTGYLYNDDGKVIDPANGNILAVLGSSGLVAPDSSLNQIFMLGQTSAQFGSDTYTIQSFNQTNFTPGTSLVIPNITGVPRSLIRWGDSGFALVTYINNTAGFPSGMLYIVKNSGFTKQLHSGNQPFSESQPVSRTWTRSDH